MTIRLILPKTSDWIILEEVNVQLYKVCFEHFYLILTVNNQKLTGTGVGEGG